MKRHNYKIESFNKFEFMDYSQEIQDTLSREDLFS